MTAVGNAAIRHSPVLLKEVVNYMLGGSVPLEKAVFVDATFGSGGHSRGLLESGASLIYGIDKDPLSLQYARELQAQLLPHQQLVVAQGTFSKMSSILRTKGVQPESVHGILMDLGTSSMQLDDSERGFSFNKCGPLDMRMDPSQQLTAKDLVNTLSEEQISSCLLKYGDERFHQLIARSIVRARQHSPIETTAQLAQVVYNAVGWHRASNMKDGLSRSMHPATRTFQALRIVVNNELEELAAGLLAAQEMLAPKGRLVVISFHSLEDRIVKRFLSGESSLPLLMDNVKGGGYRRTRRSALKQDSSPVLIPCAPTWHLLHSKIIRASQLEVLENPRARSAKLRASVKVS
jgi:16S rRNA (cytosine(1402)-N(4))-methyltransferase